jgi:hypothetical protein
MTKDQLTQANALEGKLSTQKEKVGKLSSQETIEHIVVNGHYFRVSPALGKTIYLLVKQDETEKLNDLQQQFDVL